jgi:ATP-dependent DNA helicase RecG
MIQARLSALLIELTRLSYETEWVEFKHNNCHHQEIGEYISALSNSAALAGKPMGYIVWGIEDSTHRIVGTTFNPKKEKVGNEALENWLRRLLSPRLEFQIQMFQHAGKDIVFIEVPMASNLPVRFRGEEYIRCGNHKQKLKDFPETERSLWALFSRQPFEKGIALEDVNAYDVIKLIDHEAYFRLINQRPPDNQDGILERLESEKFIVRTSGTYYHVTNLGGMLFGTSLLTFDRLARKAPRVIVYKGLDRTQTTREQPGRRGYASGFEGLIAYINSQLPENEEIGQALRKQVRMYPEIAVRELVANALIHQDFSITGTGPMVEIFADRIEITNPGTPLIEPNRFIDETPQSRNEALASFMRRINICEERGSGIDKVIKEVETYQLPAPDFTVTANHTKAVLFSYRKLARMDKQDRVRACYQHACLKQVSNDFLTNSSLRQRFAIGQKNYPMASRIISDTIAAGLIKKFEPEFTSRKDAKYLPFWA